VFINGEVGPNAKYDYRADNVELRGSGNEISAEKQAVDAYLQVNLPFKQ
jgi:hypothetical protein